LRVIRTVSEMVELGGGDLGFVPTMGALHEGHLSLMGEARQRNKCVCVSLFVNPLQFGANEDFDRYPRVETRDFELAERSGVDLIFAPTVPEMYPKESTTIHVPEVADLWDGLARPGHFVGVATVVAKLFNMVRPRDAYFGWKDLQQCLVVRRMVEDLRIQVHLRFMPTVREGDGLAVSSRNAYLSCEDRAKAPLLYRTLIELATLLARNHETVDDLLRDARARLAKHGFDVHYLELVSMVDLKPTNTNRGTALIVAATLGKTRLIDNIQLDGFSL